MLGNKLIFRIIIYIGNFSSLKGTHSFKVPNKKIEFLSNYLKYFLRVRSTSHILQYKYFKEYRKSEYHLLVKNITISCWMVVGMLWWRAEINLVLWQFARVHNVKQYYKNTGYLWFNYFRLMICSMELAKHISKYFANII